MINMLCQQEFQEYMFVILHERNLQWLLGILKDKLAPVVTHVVELYDNQFHKCHVNCIKTRFCVAMKVSKDQPEPLTWIYLY